jgi:hypothetical protein
VLTWTTRSETNNAGFEIEHDGGNGYQRIGYVGGAGTVTTPQAYSYRAEGLAPGTHRFRLRQVDFDGAFAYSPVTEVSITLDAAFAFGALYPNPFNPSASFTLAVHREQRVTVEVYDLMGRRMALLNRGVLAGDRAYTFTVDGSGWASGTYVVVAAGETFQSNQVITLLK